MNNFYYPSLLEIHQIVELDGNEAKHMTGARRLKPGDQVTLFNGNGLVANGRIELVTAKDVRINLEDINQLDLPSPKIILASAIPKGDRFSVLLDMATQLGMTDFIPLNCDRSVIKTIKSKIERYNRICIGACKQSQRYYLPQIHSALTLRQLFEQTAPSTVCFLADPKAECESEICISNLNAEAIILIVGPEGGFSEVEQELFTHLKINKIKLSRNILRTETACISVLSKINYRQIN